MKNALADANMDAIHRWLTSAEGRDVVSECAKLVYREADTRCLSPHLLHLEHLPETPDREVLADIESTLVEFILSRPAIINELHISESHHKGLLLLDAFVRYWIDVTRNKGDDPRRYLRKRVLDVFREADDILTKEEDSRFFYCRRRHGEPLSDGYPQFDPADIPLPPDISKISAYDAIKRGKHLLRLAEWFWDRFVDYRGRAVWVWVNALIDWLSYRFPLDRATAVDLEAPEFKGSPLRMAGGNEWFDAEKVEQWACQCAARLSEKEGRAWLLKWRAELSLAEMATEMGYASPTTAQRYLGDAEAAIRLFIRDLDWISPDDHNETAVSLFFEKMAAELENRFSGS